MKLYYDLYLTLVFYWPKVEGEGNNYTDLNK